MAAQLYYLPFAAAAKPTNIGAPGAKAYFYAPGSTTLRAIYSTSALTTPLSNPVIADGAGRFADIYLDNTLTYKHVITDKNGAVLFTKDPYIPGTAPDASSLSPYADAAAASAVTASTWASAARVSASDAADSAASADASSDAALAAVAEIDVEVSNLPVPSRDILSIASTAVPAYLSEAGREGVFVFDSSDLSAMVTADTKQGIYVAPDSDTTGATGAWVRQYAGEVNARWFGAVGDGTTDDKAAIQAAHDLLTAGGGKIVLPAGYTFKLGSTVVLSNNDVTLAADGATITSALTVAAAMLTMSGARVKVEGGTWKLTAGDDDPWFFNVTGANCEIIDPRMVKTPDAGGYHAYFRHTADGLKTRGMRAEGSNGFYVECSNASFEQTKVIGRAAGGDDCFALKAISDSCRNVTIDDVYAENLVSVLSIGSEIGGAAVADATYSKTVGQVSLSNAKAKNCYGLVFIKPGAVSGADYRDGTVEDVTLTNLELIDESGTKFERGIAITASRGARVRGIYGRNITVRGRSVGGVGRLVGAVDLYIPDYAAGTAETSISNVDLQVSYTDPYSGLANDGSHPGYPVTYGAAVQVETYGTGVYSDIRLALSINGSAQSAVVIGPSSSADLDGQVELTRVRIANSNQTNTASHGGLVLSNVIVISDPNPSVVPAFGSAYNLTLLGAVNGPSFAGSLVSAGVVNSTSPSAGVGYATGAGGVVTQPTGKGNPVTLNKVSGQITMNNAALAGGAKITFSVNNSRVTATDTVIVSVASGGTANAYRAAVTAIAAGSFAITVENITAGSLSEAPVINFAKINAVAA